MLGFIGCGNMAQAMIKGILEKKLYAADDIIVSRRSREALSKLKDQFGVHVTADNKKVAGEAEVLVLAVKPFQFETVIQEIRDEIRKDALIISIAAGQTMENIESFWQEYQISEKYA